jgi:magnesium-protoporphyrin O-methyltransferase
VDVDGSPAYVATARDEAARQGVAGRVTYLTGDAVALEPSIEPADLVALDRVVCCYPDMAALVALAANRARFRIGFVYPRDTPWIRAMAGLANGVARLFRRRTRIWIHPTADVERIVADAGLRPSWRRLGLLWQVAVFERA